MKSHDIAKMILDLILVENCIEKRKPMHSNFYSKHHVPIMVFFLKKRCLKACSLFLLRLGPPFVALFLAISDKIHAANKQNLQSSPPHFFKYVSTRSLKSVMARLSVSICGTGRSQYTCGEHAFNQPSISK